MTATITPKPPATKRPKPAVKRASRKSARGVKRKRRRPMRRPVPPIQWRTLPFASFVAALLCLGMIALLLVNNSLAAGSFERARLKAERTLLFEQEQSLNQEVMALSSPEKLHKQARRIGMVPASSSAFLDVSTGKILGVLQTTKPGAPVKTLSESDAGETAEQTDSAVADEAGPVLSDASPVITGNEGDGAQSDETVSDGSEDQASVTDPSATGDGAQISSGTAQDRAIVSGGE